MITRKIDKLGFGLSIDYLFTSDKPDTTDYRIYMKCCLHDKYS